MEICQGKIRGNQSFDFILHFWYSTFGERLSMKKGVDFIGVGVGAVIVDQEGKVFLAKRGKEARNEIGKWEFPGGSVEFGETLEQALVREVAEEYGFTIEPQELLDVVDHIIPAESQHWVSPTFICAVKRGTPSIKEPHKCDDIGWFSLDQIPVDQLTIASRHSLESFRKRARRTCA
jgi:mutator protein MutT